MSHHCTNLISTRSVIGMSLVLLFAVVAADVAVVAAVVVVVVAAVVA